jgi:flagellar motility protein MotE (MotC chaperone)/transcription termination factor NusB
LDYTTLNQLRRLHPAWRLLLADHAPLIISFLDAAFIQPNARTLAEAPLRSQLEDLLFQLRENHGEDAFPRGAGDYLNDWADNGKGWLRKFYPPGSDEAHFDLTPATEKALSWLESLTQRQFVGTESRLRTVFDLLQQMIAGTETDKQARLDDLHSRRAAIDREIARVEAGDITLMDDTAQRERFQQLSGTAKELLADFRQVEQNFRQLDREAREQITAWEGSKGDLLARIFGERDAISDTDQGRTFRAFWEFLMSPSRQEELSEGLERVFELDAVQTLKPDARFKRIHFDWLDAGEQTQRTVARLSRQLRRFLDDQTYLENKRIMQLIQSLETQALGLRDAPPEATLMAMESPQAGINLAMERPLFSPPLKPVIESAVEVGDESDVDPEALFNQVVVERKRLEEHIRDTLRDRSQATLADVIERHPLQVGLAELVTYLSIASEHSHASFDDSQQDNIRWIDDTGTGRRARIQRIIFIR